MRLATAASDVVSGDLAPCDDGHLPSGPDGRRRFDSTAQARTGTRCARKPERRTIGGRPGRRGGYSPADAQCRCRRSCQQRPTRSSWRRPRRALQLRPPRPQAPAPEPVHGPIRRRPILGGLINDMHPRPETADHSRNDAARRAHRPRPHGCGRGEWRVWPDHAPSSRAEFHQATGIVLAQLGVSAPQALARMRGYAFVEQRLLIDVARDVVSRRLQFTQQMNTAARPPVAGGARTQAVHDRSAAI